MSNNENMMSDGNDISPSEHGLDTGKDASASADIFEWHYSGKGLRGRCLLVWLCTFLLAGIGIYLTMNSWVPENWVKPFWGVLIFILVAIWGHFLWIYWYRTQTITYRLTEHRLELIEGIFTRQTDPIELLYIEDMRLELRLIDRIINGGVGRITIFSSVDKTHSQLHIDAIENPRDVYERIDAARCRVRAKRGFITT